MGMKALKGFAFLPLLIVVGILVVGGITYAVVPHTVLKVYFEKGDKPTEAQFESTVDSKEYNPTKNYEVGDTSVKNTEIHQAKVLTEATTEFKLDADAPVTFKWAPIAPTAGSAVTYRLRVWQLMQGQNGTQAMKSNQPVVTKEVSAGTEATVSGLYTGPCKPPYLCDFVWAVDVAAKADGSATGAGSTGTR